MPPQVKKKCDRLRCISMNFDKYVCVYSLITTAIKIYSIYINPPNFLNAQL